LRQPGLGPHIQQMKTRHRFRRGRLLELAGKIFVLTEQIRSRQDTRQTKLLSYDTGQRRTWIIVTARDRYDTFANAALEVLPGTDLGRQDVIHAPDGLDLLGQNQPPSATGFARTTRPERLMEN